MTEDFVVVARLEGFISGCSIFEVLQRAKAYQEAGADALLIHSKKSTDAEIRLFCQHWPKSLPLIIVPTTYSDFDQSWLADAGIRMVIWANQSVRASAHAMMETCAYIKNHKSPTDNPAPMASMHDLFELFSYE